MNATLPSKEPINPRSVALYIVASRDVSNRVTPGTVTWLLMDGKGGASRWSAQEWTAVTRPRP